MHLIDLSHTIEPGMPLFSDAAPAPEIRPWMSHERASKNGFYDGCTSEITQVNFVTSIGTYLDSPFHFNPHGKSIESIDLDCLVLPGIVIDCTHIKAREPINPEILDNINISGKAVLFHTGWSRYWGVPKYFEYPFLTKDTALVLVERGAMLTGVDFLVIDDTNNPKRPVHVTLLKNNVLIVENLTNLNLLPQSGFTFHAVPVKVKRAAAFPVRSYAVLEDQP